MSHLVYFGQDHACICLCLKNKHILIYCSHISAQFTYINISIGLKSSIGLAIFAIEKGLTLQGHDE